jgi:hypothetical protein
MPIKKHLVAHTTCNPKQTPKPPEQQFHLPTSNNPNLKTQNQKAETTSY